MAKRKTTEKPQRLSIEEARAVMLVAQGLSATPTQTSDLDDLRALIERLGIVQIDTINVVTRSQYLVLWSRLGPYDPAMLNALLSPHRDIFEYWAHAASIVPMSDYRYYRPDMLRARETHDWSADTRAWLASNPDILTQTLETIRDRGPMASAEFERAADARRTGPWDWYGPKESRRALDVLWTSGDLMIHSRRGGQKLYDLRERVLAEAFGDEIPGDENLPTAQEVVRYFVRRTTQALGIVTPSWLWDYFRLRSYYRSSLDSGKRGAVTTRAAAQTLLDELTQTGEVVCATVDGLSEPAYLHRERLPDLARSRDGATPERTTLLSPFDSLIWDRARARALFGYEVCFEAYVVPEKRRYGYYCLAILHRGRIVGRVDPKFDRTTQQLLIRAVYLEPEVPVDDALLDGLAAALRELARFLGAREVVALRSEPETLAPALAERLEGAFAFA